MHPFETRPGPSQVHVYIQRKLCYFFGCERPIIAISNYWCGLITRNSANILRCLRKFARAVSYSNTPKALPGDITNFDILLVVFWVGKYSSENLSSEPIGMFFVDHFNSHHGRATLMFLLACFFLRYSWYASWFPSLSLSLNITHPTMILNQWRATRTFFRHCLGHTYLWVHLYRIDKCWFLRHHPT